MKKVVLSILMLIASVPALAQTHPVQQQSRASKLYHRVQAAIVAEAKSFKDVPYVFGGDSARTGLDCSSYVQKVFADLGVHLPRTAKEQAHSRDFEVVPRADIQTGDLIFFKNTYKPGISHVGIMLDKTHMMHASSENGYITDATLIKGGTLSRKIAVVERLKPRVRREIAESI